MTGREGKVHGVLSFAIGLTSDQGRLALQHLLNTVIHAHPTFRIEVGALDKCLIVRGDDELQLMEVREEISAKIEENVKELTINYKESIYQAAEAEVKCMRPAGGLGNYGHVTIRMEPTARSVGFQFVDAIKGGVAPKEYIKPTEQGIREVLTGGILAGYEVVDSTATLYDGSYHEIDSIEMAIKIAGSLAFKEAARKAHSLLLEPMMAVEITGA